MKNKKKPKFLKPMPKKLVKSKPKLSPTPKQTASQFKPGASGNPQGRPSTKGQTLMTRVREMMKLRTLDPHTGKMKFRFDIVADAFIRQMESGSIMHVKEYIEREEGKVPTRIADADGNNLKAYVNMPLEGEESP